jgi:hypothetical protein
MKKLGFYLVMASLLVSYGCNLSEDEAARKETHVLFELKNNSDLDTHMWITGEDIMPNNKLAPGEQRKVTYIKSAELMDENSKIKEDPVTVSVGRNGTVLTSRIVYVDYFVSSFIVTYDGSSIVVR